MIWVRADISFKGVFINADQGFDRLSVPNWLAGDPKE